MNMLSFHHPFSDTESVSLLLPMFKIKMLHGFFMQVGLHSFHLLVINYLLLSISSSRVIRIIPYSPQCSKLQLLLPFIPPILRISDTSTLPEKPEEHCCYFFANQFFLFFVSPRLLHFMLSKSPENCPSISILSYSRYSFTDTKTYWTTIRAK